MRTIGAVVAALAVAVVLSGCAAEVKPAAIRAKPAVDPAIGVTTPVSNPSAKDAEYVRERESVDENPEFDYAKPASFAEAKRLFPQAMLPRETLGGRLIAIRYRGTDNEDWFPKQQLTLRYEGRLTVGVVRGSHGGYPDMGIPETEESTEVAGVTAEVELWAPVKSGDKGIAYVQWRVGDLDWSVSGEGLTKDDVVKVARSLAP